MPMSRIVEPCNYPGIKCFFENKLMEQVFVGRQPILSKNEKIYGFELLFRDPSTTGAKITNHIRATATVMTNALNNIGFKSLVGEKRGFINVDADILSSGLIDLLPKENVVLELLEHVEVDEKLLSLCKALKARGYVFALDDFVYGDAFLPLFEIAQYVKIEILGNDRGSIEETLGILRKYPVKLLAEKVETKEDFLYCSSLGFDYFQGYFFSKPTIVAGQSISPSQSTLFRLFNSLAREEDVNVIEKVFKQNPQLDFKLLRFMNSAAFYVAQKVTSIRHAIAMLGYRNLQKWVSLLLFANQTDDMKSNPLLEQATIRGIIMELLAHRETKSRVAGDTAFIVGILSLMDALLCMPISEAISDLNLSPEISDALLERKGLAGMLLEVTEKLEQQDMEGLKELLFPMNINLDDVLAMETKAITEYENII